MIGKIPFMSFKALFRTFIFLLILFAVLFVGISNMKTIDFSLPGILTKDIRASAALIYFGMFAIGVLGGTLLHTGAGGGGRRSGGGKEK